MEPVAAVDRDLRKLSRASTGDRDVDRIVNEVRDVVDRLVDSVSVVPDEFLIVAGTFAPQGLLPPIVTSFSGTTPGWTVIRTGVGQYTMTITDPDALALGRAALVSKYVDFMSALARVDVQFAGITANLATVLIFVFNAAGAFDPAAGANEDISFELKLKKVI